MKIVNTGKKEKTNAQETGGTAINTDSDGKKDASEEPKKSKLSVNFDKMLDKPIRYVDRVDGKLSKIGLFRNMSVVGRRVLIIVMTLLSFFVLLILILGIVYRLFNQPIIFRENPIPSPVTKITPPPVEIRNPSKYAEDETVLKLERKISELDKQITDTNVRETTLNPPSLNFEVEFE